MSSHTLTYFIHWYNNTFKQTSMYADMANTVENTPYHREQSVAIHTDMVVMNGISAYSHFISLKEGLLALFACAFHDTGKPACEEQFITKDGELRKKYQGHEKKSTSLWLDYYATNEDMFVNKFGINRNDAWIVSWMISHHQPWKITNPMKLQALTQTTKIANVFGAYETMLMSDAIGRIADNPLDPTVWFKKFTKAYLEQSFEINDTAPYLVVPIGPTGSGKSTVYEKSFFEYDLHSPDQLRLDWYSKHLSNSVPEKDVYAECFRMSLKDKSFSKNEFDQFIAKVKSHKNIYLDRTNLTKKSRRKYIAIARQHGYSIIGVFFIVSKAELKKRQRERINKQISDSTIEQQYDALTPPSYVEFDRIIIK